MSEDQNTTTAAAEVSSTEADEVTTLNTHATINPLKTATATAEGEATPNNTHATEETA